MTTEWWWLEGSPRSRRDPREGDPEWYREAGGAWVKRTRWNAENGPDPLQDWRSYARYMTETTPMQSTETSERAGKVSSDGKTFGSRRSARKSSTSTR